MTPLTQPMTDAERVKAREWYQLNAINAGCEPQGLLRCAANEASFINALPEPVKFDYFALNREFSE